MATLSRKSQNAMAASRFYRAFFQLNSCKSNSYSLPVRSKSLSTRRELSSSTLFQYRRSTLTTAARDQTASYSTSTSAETPPSDQDSLSNHVRHLMRRVPHPIVVITATLPPTSLSSPLESTFRGMTLSSFNTVTLDPTPLVSFNVRVPSATYSALRSGGGHFLAHFLSATEPGARIAAAFTRGYQEGDGPFAELTRQAAVQVFVAKEQRGDGGRSPLLVGDGIRRVLRCRLLEGKEVDIGDHKVVVGEVIGIVGSAEERLAGRKPEIGLIYAEGGYRKAGEEIALPTEEQLEEENQEEANFERSGTVNLRKGVEQMSN